jgi:hypothetical protein
MPSLLYADNYKWINATSDVTDRGLSINSISVENHVGLGQNVIKFSGTTSNLEYRAASASEYFDILIHCRDETALEATRDLLVIYQTSLGTNAQLTIRTLDTGVIRIVGAAANFDSAAGAWTTGTHHVRIKGRIHDTLGWCEVYVDGSQTAAVSCSNVDTKLNASANWQSYKIFRNSGFRVVGQAAWSGADIAPGAPPSSPAINLLTATGTSATNTGFTASAGTKHGCVDETPYSTADFVHSTAAGRVSFTHAGALIGVVEGVEAFALASHNALPLTAAFMAALLRSGSTNYLGTALEMNAAQDWKCPVYRNSLNPNGSVAWTAAAANAAEFGVEIPAGQAGDELVEVPAAYMVVVTGVTDSTAPTILSATAHGNGEHVIVVFSEPVTTDGSGFSVRVGQLASNLTVVSGSGTDTVTFDLSFTIGEGSTPFLSYNSATGNCLDLNNNELVSFSDLEVTNNSTISLRTVIVKGGIIRSRARLTTENCFDGPEDIF